MPKRDNYTSRSKTTGQYSYSRMERMCACGHNLGVHTAEVPHACISGDFADTVCDCEKFRPVRDK